MWRDLLLHPVDLSRVFFVLTWFSNNTSSPEFKKLKRVILGVHSSLNRSYIHVKLCAIKKNTMFISLQSMLG